jgi:hypothetical protein
MKLEELNQKHPLYEEHIADWELYDLINISGRRLIEYSLYQHPRESPANHAARLRDGYVFNFGKSIIDLFNFYLCEKDAIRLLRGLEKDPLWRMFEKDADLNNTNYNVLIDEAQKLASSFGSIGILVNKPPGGGRTVAESIKKKVYPYYALYNLMNIYDWKWEKDPSTHRKALVRLKLKEANGDWLLWKPESWEIWSVDRKTNRPYIKDQGENPLGEIPFVWMTNLKDLSHPEVGSSDLVDIAPIVTSIAQNLSCGEEMMKLAGFPIRRQPMERADDEPGGDEFVDTGPVAVEEFNPEHGEAGKPDWMPTEVYEPIRAILEWVDRKSDEIYRIAHMSGVHGQRKSNNEVASGMAVRYEFSQLNSVLIGKSINQTEAELQLLRLWLKWQNKESLFNKIEISRSNEFSIDELSIAIDNILRAFRNVLSRTFRIRVQQKIAKEALPDLPEEDKETINNEIEENTPEKVELLDHKDNKTADVRSGLESRADHSRDNESKPVPDKSTK